jgi:hypothetical protein
VREIPAISTSYVIAQRYDAKILTALLAVGDCIYFDLGTP